MIVTIRHLLLLHVLFLKTQTYTHKGEEMKCTKAHQEVLVAGYSDISNKYGKFKMNRNLICVIIPFKL